MFCIDAAQDAMLTYIRTNVNRLWVCSGDPQTYGAANTAKLAEVAIDQYSFNAPEVGDTDGRKMVLTEQADIAITASGSGAHLCFVYTTGSVLVYSIQRSFDKPLTIGSLVTIPATSIAIRDQTIISS